MLRALQQAGLACGERRALARYAVEVALLGKSDVVSRHDDLEHFEHVLIAMTVDGRKPTVSEAKVRLRRCGAEGIALAKRVQRASKTRNGVAHPDVSLESDLTDFLPRCMLEPGVPTASLQGCTAFPAAGETSSDYAHDHDHDHDDDKSTIADSTATCNSNLLMEVPSLVLFGQPVVSDAASPAVCGQDGRPPHGGDTSDDLLGATPEVDEAACLDIQPVQVQLQEISPLKQIQLWTCVLPSERIAMLAGLSAAAALSAAAKWLPRPCTIAPDASPQVHGKSASRLSWLDGRWAAGDCFYEVINGYISAVGSSCPPALRLVVGGLNPGFFKVVPAVDEGRPPPHSVVHLTNKNNHLRWGSDHGELWVRQTDMVDDDIKVDLNRKLKLGPDVQQCQQKVIVLDLCDAGQFPADVLVRGSCRKGAGKKRATAKMH